MENAKKKRINRLQNITMIALSCLALCLFFYSFFPIMGMERPNLAAFFSSRTQSVSFWDGENTASLSAPVQVSVTGQHGRFGCAATLSHESLIPLNTLAKEAFGSAGATIAATEETFRAALLQSGVYYDFSLPLPASLLSSMLDTSIPSAFSSVQRLLLAADSESVRLFLFDGTEYYVSTTAISPGTLETTIAIYEPNDTAFLFERSGDSHTLDPFTLITEDMLSRPGYICATPSAGSENNHILEFLGFNSHSNSRYVESDGTEVIFGSDATIRIESDGTVTYAGTHRSNSVFLAEDNSADAAITAAYRIASGLLSSSAGEAALYLADLEDTDLGYTVSFNFMAGGIPIRFHDGAAAASITVSDGVVTAFTLRCRNYTLSDTTLHALPLTQALAIAADKQGALKISYVDNGTNALSVSWIVTQ